MIPSSSQKQNISCFSEFDIIWFQNCIISFIQTLPTSYCRNGFHSVLTSLNFYQCVMFAWQGAGRWGAAGSSFGGCLSSHQAQTSKSGNNSSLLFQAPNIGTQWFLGLQIKPELLNLLVCWEGSTRNIKKIIPSKRLVLCDSEPNRGYYNNNIYNTLTAIHVWYHITSI